MLTKILKYFYSLLLLEILFGNNLIAHEPIFGNGPHVLFKGGFAPVVTVETVNGIFESEYALEYGLTSNFTIGTDLIFNNENNSYDFGGLKLKGKYRFYSKYKKGSLLQFSVLGGISIPKAKEANAINLGLTAGNESTDFYWFSSMLYFRQITNKIFNKLNYDLTLGYRVTELNYYKPDLVLFLEFSGKHIFAADNENSGSVWSIAPTFMLTYRNYALRSGIQFDVGSTGKLTKSNPVFKIALEMHI